MTNRVVLRIRTFIAVMVLTGWLTTAPGLSIGEREALGQDFAQCAAYFFNAAKAKQMSHYETLYGAAEVAFNRAKRMLGSEEAERLMADASSEISAIMGGDWLNFARVEVRFSGHCTELINREVERK